MLLQTTFDCTAALNSIRDGPIGHGDLAAVMEAVITGINGMFVYSLLSIFWLSGVGGVRRSGDRHGLASRLRRLGCCYFSPKTIRQKRK